MATISWVVFFFFLIAMISIGIIRSRRTNTTHLYLLAGEKTKLFALVATLVMTEFNASTLIAFSSAGYSAQWWALSLPFIFLIGLLFYAATVAKKWKTFNGVSIARFFSRRYGQDVGHVVAVILFSAMVGFTATYVKSLTLIFAPLFPHVNPWLVSSVLVGLVLLMTWRGGLMAIIRTDIISFLIMLIFFPLLLVHTWHLPSTIPAVRPLTLHHMQQALPPKFVGSLILLTMFSYILAPWYGQKVISAHSPRIATLAVAIAAFFIFVLYSLAIVATGQLTAKGITLMRPEQALPYLINHALSPGLQGVGYAVLFLAGATTLAGVWSAMVTLLTRNKYTNAQEERRLFRSFLLTGGCALLSYLFANLFVDRIFSKMILANIPIVALSFALLAGFYWKKATKLGVYISIITGLVWGIGCYLYYGEKNIYTWYWAIYGIPFIFVSGAVSSLFSRSSQRYTDKMAVENESCSVG